MRRVPLTYVKFWLVGLVAGVGLIAAGPAGAQVAVPVSQAEVIGAVATCTASKGCEDAIQGLIAELAAANPDVDLQVIIGTVISAIASAYNDGKIPAAAAQAALTATASIATAKGFPDLAVAAASAATVVAQGGTINLEAVAEASASPA